MKHSITFSKWKRFSKKSKKIKRHLNFISFTFQPFASLKLLFAWRYFKSKKTTNAVNIIAGITVVAMAVGTAALVIVLSVFNGFESLVKGLYSSFYPDLKITSAQQKIMIIDSAQLSKIRQLNGIAAISFVIEENVHLQNGDARANAVIKGVDTAYKTVCGLSGHLINGNYDIGNQEQPRFILGSGIESALGLLSDRAVAPVTVYLPRRGVPVSADPLAAISTVNIQTSGTFAIQQDFDNKYAITNLEVVRAMLAFNDNEYTAAELLLQKNADPDEVQKRLQSMLGSLYRVETRYEQNKSLFSIMQIEKWAIYGILTMMLVIAAFNMIGSLTMLVLEKQQDMQILKAMGATNRLVQNIFLTEGVLLAFIGGVSGTLLALLFCYLQVQWKLIPLEGSFVIDYYPVKVKPVDILLVFSTVFLVSVGAAWIPSRKAARQSLSLKGQ